MRWRKGTTCWPAYAGTSATLSETIPKAVQKQRSGSTLWTSCWSFCTTEATERFLSDRKAMSQASETIPMTRSHLWVICDEKSQLFQVWEVVDKVPPSTAPELEPNRNLDLFGGETSQVNEPASPSPCHREVISNDGEGSQELWWEEP